MIRVELANKIRDGRAVGNLWLVIDRGPEGMHCNVLLKTENEQEARIYADTVRGAK